MISNDMLSILHQMRRHFGTGITKTYDFRRRQLLALKKAIESREQELYAALYADLKKSPEECWITEIGFVLSELKNTIRHLRSWMQAEAKRTNLLNFPSSSQLVYEPLGVVLIAAPWNYPLQLLFTPLIGAIAAGNCVMLKPSEFAPATSAVMQEIITHTFPPEYIGYTTGDGATVIPVMMNEFRFDHIFYTGSTVVGRILYKLAAAQLVPVTLELGGKSPCVVEADAKIAVTAKRIVMTKFSNAGQMCVAPDYLLVHHSVKDQLLEAMKQTIGQFFTESPETCYHYGKIINQKQFHRIIAYLKQGTVVHGGRTDETSLFIEPTILDHVAMDAPVMQEEIFGPVLPVIGFDTMEEAKAIIAKNPNPLAFYIFTSSPDKEKEWIQEIPAGGVCINNASWHLTNHHLPFGGRGNSGIGAYHGKYSFETFSHRKAIMKTPTWFDPALKYPPFKGKLKLFKWITG